MAVNPYVKFLPPEHRAAAATNPETTWWGWRGHDVHVARARRPEAAARVLLLHGAGGHSEAVWPLAALLAERGLDVAAVDLPLYGLTRSPAPRSVTYDDWVALVLDLVAVEDDGRPLVLFGTSMGGMLAYEVAARSGSVAAVAATCLLDPNGLRARRSLTRFGVMSTLGGLLAPLVRGRVATAMVPMRRVADVSRLSRDPELAALCGSDPRGGGASVPLGFLATYMRYRHVEPGSMTTPVALVHPAMDTWTPPSLSLAVARRTAAPVKIVMLRECGHFPVEQPGLGDLLATVCLLADEAGRAGA
ncbi:alpha/beta hydrolase [Flavimobilis sp. GY10621]|uniref:Alpha/beta hydrolase n=1 Tax=Flavimobilis rhizosphaerae TaxID=2775421 RepID=A0ABR9DSD0_9MICO|nr:alpha/beta hydrolase [Flavimobilis rhizosphaerae]MBD9699913.1 alpha/beta hydrolase [Flavimobilis rhizosphaerae]